MTFTAALKATVNADQLEVDAVERGAAPIAGCLRDEKTAGVDLTEEFDPATNPNDDTDWAKQAAAQETGEREAAEVLDRRADLLGKHYPFRMSDDRAQLIYLPDRSRSGVYELCLAFATTGHQLKEKPHCYAVQEFERLVGQLLAAHFGSGTKWFRFGMPPDPKRGDERPTKLTDALADMHRRTHGEWEFHPPIGENAPAEQGDRDIDVVVWKPFGELDNRIGKPFVLAQCACGGDSLSESKWNSLQPEKFQRDFVGVLSFAGALKAYATPYHIYHPRRWHEAVGAAGIVLDRVRLTWMAESCVPQAEANGLKEKLAPHTINLNRPLVRSVKVRKPKKPTKPKRK